MTIDTVIYGAGGHAGEILWLISEINQVSTRKINILGLLSDDVASHGKTIWNKPVLGGEEWLKAHRDIPVILGIGNPKTRQSLVDRIQPWVSDFPTLIHPNAVVSESAVIEKGCVVCSGSTISVGVKIGKFTHLNINAYVAHGSRIGNFVTLGPRSNICGDVVLGKGVDVGCNATVIQGLSVGDDGIIGAGAVVLSDTLPNRTYVGVPAKALSSLKSIA